ncbi:MAG: ABC transporter ATP-binding protein [Actinomycetes bacterium]
MSDVISAIGLQKSFGHTKALDGLDLAVQTGEVHGFLGPNGSGKSTTLRVLLGMLRSDGGQVSLLGGDPWRQATELHRRLAYVPGDVTLWPNLTGGQVIDLLGRLRGGIDPARTADLLERFQLDPTRKSRTYSKGNRQKVALVSALASDAELLLLDEPTSGLDPLMEAAFRDYLSTDRPADQTVLLSSHILSEVEAACDRVTIIRDGRTIETGSLSEMRHLSASSITADLVDPTVDLRSVPGVRNLAIDGNQLRCQVDPGDLGAVLRILDQAGINNLECAPATLEQLFLQHYTDAPATAPAPADRTEASSS